MGSSLLWVKALHIVFVSSWFAGLFYLPRLFVNLASVPADSHAERERLLMMARKLYRFSSLLMVGAIALGLVLWLAYGVGKGPHNYWPRVQREDRVGLSSDLSFRTGSTAASVSFQRRQELRSRRA